MEKLQEALQKARARRSGGPVSSPNLANPAQSPAPRATSVDQAWAALDPLTPNRDTLIKNRIVAYDAGADATHFDILRTKVLLQMRKNGWKRLAITSPTSACGKTTTACNLAVGLSRQPDMRTMLLELDLRRPNVANLVGQKPQRDITSMLTGQISFADQAIRVRDNVAISMARRASTDPTKYLLSQQTEDTLRQIEQTYKPDIMIFDLPPLLLSDDTRAFLNNVDCALMVARAERSSINQIDTCEREIAEHTNMLGVVLNQCRHVDDAQGYGYEAY